MCHTLDHGGDSLAIYHPGARDQSGGQDGGGQAIEHTQFLGEVDRQTTFGELGDRDEVEGEMINQEDSGERNHLSKVVEKLDLSMVGRDKRVARGNGDRDGVVMLSERGEHRAVA